MTQAGRLRAPRLRGRNTDLGFFDRYGWGVGVKESLARSGPVLAAAGVLLTIVSFSITLNGDRREWLQSNWDFGWLLVAVLVCLVCIATVIPRAHRGVRDRSARSKLKRENDDLRRRLADLEREFSEQELSSEVPAPVPVIGLTSVRVDEQGGMQCSISNWTDDTILDLELRSLHPHVTFGPLVTTFLHPQQFPYAFGPDGPAGDPIELRDEDPTAQSVDVDVFCSGPMPSELSVVLTYSVNRQVRRTQRLATGLAQTEPSTSRWSRLRRRSRGDSNRAKP